MYFRLNFEYNLEFFRNDATVMLVTFLRCWWRNHYVGDFFQCIESVTNIDRLQHPSPSSL